MKQRKNYAYLLVFSLTAGLVPTSLEAGRFGGGGGHSRGGGHSMHSSSHSRGGSHHGSAHGGRSGHGRSGGYGHGNHHNWGGHGYCHGGWGWWGGAAFGYFFLGTWVTTIALSSVNASNYNSTVNTLNDRIDRLNDKMDDLKTKLSRLQDDLYNADGDDSELREQVRGLQEDKKQLHQTLQVVRAELKRVKAYKEQGFKNPEKLEAGKPQAPDGSSEHANAVSSGKRKPTAKRKKLEQEINQVDRELADIESQIDDAS